MSFNTAESPQKFGSRGEVGDLRDLPATIAYSYGRTQGGGNQQNHRHLLLVKAGDPPGAGDTSSPATSAHSASPSPGAAAVQRPQPWPPYLVIRNRTVDGQPQQRLLPPDWPPVTALIDGQPAAAQRDGRRLTIALPAGEHRWSLRP